MKKELFIGPRRIAADTPVFIIAELSANHLMQIDRAKEILAKAKEAGADAIKLQTYTPDTITLDCDNPYFHVKQGSIWDGEILYQLYQRAYTPWEWQRELKDYAEALGLIFFSSPFDPTAVDFLEKLEVPAYKIASFEITDIPLIRKIAALQKPILLSTGIAALADIEEALAICRQEGNEQIILLKCTSAYPAPYEEVNLRTLVNMQETFSALVGLSDHTLGTTAAVAAVALGARVIEKHLTLKREDGGPDAPFSMEAEEFTEMVQQIRQAEKVLGQVSYTLTEKQRKSREWSRSLFVAAEIKKGEVFTEKNIKSIRPGFGLHPRYYEQVLGKRAALDIARGTPLSWEMVEEREQEE